MQDALMLLCLLLAVFAGGVKYKTRCRIKALQIQRMAAVVKKKKAIANRRQVEQELTAINLAEQELVLDCRDLAEVMQRIEERMEKIRRASQKRSQEQEPKTL